MAIETSSPVLPGSQAEISSSRSPSQESSTSDFDSILLGIPILADGETEGEAEESILSVTDYEDGIGLTALLNASVPPAPAGIVTSTRNNLLASFSEGEGMPVEGKAEAVLSSEEFLRFKGLLADAGTDPVGKAGAGEPGKLATVFVGDKELTSRLNVNVPQAQAGPVISSSNSPLPSFSEGEGVPVAGTDPAGSTGALGSSSPDMVSPLVNGEPSGRDNMSRTTEPPVFAGVNSSGNRNRSPSFSDEKSLHATSKFEKISNISYSLTHLNGGDQDGAGTEGKILLGSSASVHLVAKDNLSFLNEKVHPDGTRSQGEGSVAQPLPVSSETSTLNPRPSPEVWHSVIHRVAGEMFSSLQQNRQGALIQLEPPELGRMKIELLLHEDQMKARIVTEVADVKTLIQAHLPDLRHALQAHRLDLGEVRVDVSVWDGERGELPQGFQQESKAHQGKSQESAVQNQYSVVEDQQLAGTEIPGSNRGSGVSLWA